MGVVVEPGLHVKPLLELCAGLRLVDICNKLVDPVFDGTVHLVVSGVGLLERDRRLTGCHHGLHHVKYDGVSVRSGRAAPLGGAQ